MIKLTQKTSLYFLLVITLAIISAPVLAQNLEVVGKVKVTDMESITSGEKVVVRDGENNLAERDFDQLVINYFIGLPNGVALLVDAGESISNLVDAGASINDLISAGVSITDLQNAGVTIAELVAGGALVAAMLDAGIAPIDIFNEGIPIDSFYGKQYEGGLIFYLNTTTGEGLVAADADQSTGITWGADGITGASGTDFGTGESNTVIIVEALGFMSNYAARICFELVLNGKSDWYLPSRDELVLMGINLHVKGFGSFNDLYWSSSEFSGTHAWRVDFTNGTLDPFPKADTNKSVRAIRSFDQ